MPERPVAGTAAAAPSTAANPWVQGAASIGTAVLAVGILLAVLGGPSGYAADAGPAVVRLMIGAALSVLGLGLLLSALVIVGVGWYLRGSGPEPGPRAGSPTIR